MTAFLCDRPHRPHFSFPNITTAENVFIWKNETFVTAHELLCTSEQSVHTNSPAALTRNTVWKQDASAVSV